MDNNRRRVVITGMGAITPLGMTIDEYWGNLVAGKSGIAPGVLCDYSEYPCQIAGEVTEFDAGDFMDRKESPANRALFADGGGRGGARDRERRPGPVQGEPGAPGRGDGQRQRGLSGDRGERPHHDAAGRYARQPVLHPNDSAQTWPRPT